ncbi:MAG: OprD family outer membrane porin [Sulfuricurvum sp.]|nr:OprD family outer membrane porin [Sulfuricurvum sp.]
MKKSLLFGLVTAGCLSASGFSEAFTGNNSSGKIRIGSINQNKVVGADTYGTSLGGWLKYKTAAWNDVTFGVAAYMSQKIAFVSGEGEGLTSDFFDANGNSFVYIGEAYVDYSVSNFRLCVGRQLIETPFVNGDDVRMLPNTFEAAVGTYNAINKTTITAGYLYRWAGFDAPQGHHEHINQFNQFGVNHDSNGVIMLGVVNESIENLTLQGWIYRTDKVTDIVYTDARYRVNFDKAKSMEFLAQYARFDENANSLGDKTGMDGNVYGVGINLNLGICRAGIAYNRVLNGEGKVTDGLGGGPYYTSMEEMTIDGIEEVKAYRLRGEVDMSGAGIQGLSFAVAYGAFESAPADVKIIEMDIVAVYEMSDKLSTDMSYAKIEDRNNNFDPKKDAGYSRFLARLNYTF